MSERTMRNHHKKRANRLYNRIITSLDIYSNIGVGEQLAILERIILSKKRELNYDSTK